MPDSTPGNEKRLYVSMQLKNPWRHTKTWSWFNSSQKSAITLNLGVLFNRYLQTKCEKSIVALKIVNFSVDLC